MRRTSSSTHKCSNRFSDVLRFGFGFSLPSETGKEFVENQKQFFNHSAARTGKLGILSKAQLLDNV